MRKANSLAKVLFSAAFVTLFLGLSSCKNEAKPEDTKEVAEDQNDAKFEDNESKDDDSEFLVAAAESDLMEIEIGNLAISKGTDPGVKEFGKMLVADHTKSANEMKPFAENLQVSLPAAITDKGKEKFNDLNEKTGKDFDQKFADMMVSNHEDAISKMEKASEDAKDPAIKAWAAEKVPVLKNHLQHAKTLKDKVNNNK